MTEPDAKRLAQEGKRAGKSYGNTTIGDGAHGHLGDTYIGGDVNLHFHDCFEALSIAGSITEFLQFGSGFLDRLKKTGNETAQTADLKSLHKELNKLEDIRNQLRIIQTNLIKNRESTSKNLYDLVLAVCQDADTFHEVLADLAEHVASESSVEFSPRHWPLKTSIAQSATESLETLRPTIQILQKKHNLEHSSIDLQRYYKELNARLGQFFNQTRNRSRTSAQSAEITEILSIYQSLTSELKPHTTVLTDEDGKTRTFTLNDNGDISNEHSFNHKMIKFDLGKHADVPTFERPEHLLTEVPLFVDRIKITLYYREESERFIDIRDAHEQTFAWILQDSEYQSPLQIWLKKGSKCFWVNGKAGSGKSTLMKFVHRHPCLEKSLRSWAGSRQLIISSFFFWFAGKPLQRSQEGVLRSMIYQVIEQRPNLAPVMFPELTRYLLSLQYEPSAVHSEKLSISVSELKQALRLLAQNIPTDCALFLMIDGADEFEGDHQEFTRFLVDLAKNPSLKLLVSSRPIPECHHIFSHFPNFRLQDLTANDMRRYIECELLNDELLVDMDFQEAGFAKEVEDQLMDKASGVFLWLVLVVKKLRTGLANYDDKETLMATIDELPTDLEDLYDHMFSKMSDAYRKEGARILQTICRSREVSSTSLTALQLLAAISGKAPFGIASSDVTYNQHTEDLRVKAMDGKLRSRCCGLVEIQYSGLWHPLREPTVQFLHRTVYDYLRYSNVRQKLTKICTMDKSEIDLLLLATCVHRLRRNTNSVYLQMLQPSGTSHATTQLISGQTEGTASHSRSTNSSSLGISAALVGNRQYRKRHVVKESLPYQDLGPSSASKKYDIAVLSHGSFAVNKYLAVAKAEMAEKNFVGTSFLAATEESFLGCLEYSYRLSRKSDQRYLEFLKEADTVFNMWLQYRERRPGEELASYLKSLNNLGKKINRDVTYDPVIEITDRKATSNRVLDITDRGEAVHQALSIAKLGAFPLFFEWKLTELVKSTDKKNFCLLTLLAFCLEEDDDLLLKDYVTHIKILLKHGAVPYSQVKLRLKNLKTYNTTEHKSCWEFWVLSTHEDVYRKTVKLNITQELLQARLDLEGYSAEIELFDELLRRHLWSIETSKCPDAEAIRIIWEMIAMIDTSRNSSSPSPTS